MIKKVFFMIFVFVGIFSFYNFSYSSSNNRDEACLNGGDCLDKPSFILHVGPLGPGDEELVGENAEETVNNVLQEIITKLMIGLGTVSLFVMTVGGGYLIFYNGKDELRTKGISIFISGGVGLVVSLASGILIKIVIYLIYT